MNYGAILYAFQDLKLSINFATLEKIFLLKVIYYAADQIVVILIKKSYVEICFLITRMTTVLKDGHLGLGTLGYTS